MSSSKYEPGTVAVATVRGVPNVRVFRRTDHHGTTRWEPVANVGGWLVHADVHVTDIRPLVVLDHSHIGDALNALQSILSSNHVMISDHVYALHELAQQIEAQAKPARIPEPGLWGVVEARIFTDRRRHFIHDGNMSGWTQLDTGEHWCWDDLKDPTLIRDGIEDGAE